MLRRKWTGGDLNPRHPGCKPGIHTPELPALTFPDTAPIKLKPIGFI